MRIHGEVVINPSDEEIDEYSKYQKDINDKENELAKLTNLPALTLDNTEIFLYGNIEMPDEMEIIKSHGAQSE